MTEITYHKRNFVKVLPNGGKIIAELDLTSLGQGPYFSATADIYDKRGRWESGGCQHDEIVEHFPELEKYIKWHLFNVQSGPMHYVANSLYWLGWSGYRDGKPDSPPNIEHFKSTAIYGALESDFSFDPVQYVYQEITSEQEFYLDKNSKTTEFLAKKIPVVQIKEEAKNWLSERLPQLFEAFDSDMKVLFPDYELLERKNENGIK